jgi:hypothetical protein
VSVVGLSRKPEAQRAWLSLGDFVGLMHSAGQIAHFAKPPAQARPHSPLKHSDPMKPFECFPPSLGAAILRVWQSTQIQIVSVQSPWTFTRGTQDLRSAQPWLDGGNDT